MVFIEFNIVYLKITFISFYTNLMYVFVSFLFLERSLMMLKGKINIKIKLIKNEKFKIK